MLLRTLLAEGGTGMTLTEGWLFMVSVDDCCIPNTFWTKSMQPINVCPGSAQSHTVSVKCDMYDINYNVTCSCNS